MGRTLLSAAFDVDVDPDLVAAVLNCSISKPDFRSKAADKSVRPTLPRLRQVEEQNFRIRGALDHQLALVAHRGAIALLQLLPVELDRALGYLKPGIPALAQLVLY